jgi:hypothetical protein
MSFLTAVVAELRLRASGGRVSKITAGGTSDDRAVGTFVTDFTTFAASRIASTFIVRAVSGGMTACSLVVIMFAAV